MRTARKFLRPPAVKQPCPHCGRHISTNGFAWRSHLRVCEQKADADKGEAASITFGYEKLGNVLDYLRNERGVSRYWSADKPCIGLDEGDRLAYCLVRQKFGAMLRKHPGLVRM